ncbi:Phosphoenolpyruvate-dihydroxyacetone phosphotransferase, ADP-binding subunit DhaL [Alkalibacterium sp. AK22]|uniref:dihydroxyacetone kinase subunit DhaL n=1 Tax=Alkalibacterium sp. AK22 TaxID=1229520 RepID=UPI000452C796|nr:dihydroxyacetone kinase subunit DhaL [Alkalibacterium sp. AK22]EXJ23478.1 Phosphoenolpyruvate-dihydroxyacetone phosphotransferase, ADP-binding subunit DhaL [Alkalibacterium sp. AK22]
MATIEQWLEALLHFCEEIPQHKDQLNQLDSAIGDGDHGSNMTRGVQAVKDKLDTSSYSELTDLFKDIGMTLVSKVGGASGPLYGSAFISMAKTATESSDPTALMAAGLEGIKKRGRAEPGEKTMIDVWQPLVDKLHAGQLTQEAVSEAFQNTKEMKASKGRASYLGDRSIGHLDPGAQSSAYLFDCLMKAGVLNE